MKKKLFLIISAVLLLTTISCDENGNPVQNVEIKNSTTVPLGTTLSIEN